ncbi:MAG: hypothetical protein PHQ46_14205, partial [Negativicutes bacterium]|nr:hypothetical protein [Negativicutes bacterium]
FCCKRQAKFTPVFFVQDDLAGLSMDELHHRFLSNEILVPLMKGYPGCPANGLLRWTVSALHSDNDFAKFEEALNRILKGNIGPWLRDLNSRPQSPVA